MAVQKAPKAPVGAVFITVMFVLGPLRGVATAAVDAWVGAAAWVGGAELVGAHATISAKVSAANGATRLRSITLDKPTTLRLWAAASHRTPLTHFKASGSTSQLRPQSASAEVAVNGRSSCSIRSRCQRGPDSGYGGAGVLDVCSLGFRKVGVY